jgi:hypothetical protein
LSQAFQATLDCHICPDLLSTPEGLPVHSVLACRLGLVAQGSYEKSFKFQLNVANRILFINIYNHTYKYICMCVSTQMVLA